MLQAQYTSLTSKNIKLCKQNENPVAAAKGKSRRTLSAQIKANSKTFNDDRYSELAWEIKDNLDNPPMRFREALEAAWIYYHPMI